MKNAPYRPTSRRARRFLARYMRFVEAFGYGFVALVVAGIVYACVHRVDETVTQDGDPLLRPVETRVTVPGEAWVETVYPPPGPEATARVGQPLAVIVEEGGAIARLRAAKALADIGAPNAERTRLELIQAAQAAPRRTLRATQAGLVRFEAQAGQSLAAGGVVCRIADFGRLQVETEVTGDALARVRAGQAARIKVRFPQPTRSIVRLDVTPPAGQTIAARRLPFEDGLSDSTRARLAGELSQYTIEAKDLPGIPLRVTDVERIEVQGEAAGTSAEAGAATLSVADLQDLDLGGRVASVGYEGTLRVSELPPEVRERLDADLKASFAEKSVAGAPNQATLRLRDLKRLSYVVTVSARNDGRAESKAVAPFRSLSGSQEAKKVTVTVLMESAPSSVQAAVRKRYLADPSGGLQVQLEIVTARRTLASLLFKKE